MNTELSLMGLLRKFPDDAAAEAWFLKHRWPDGVRWPACNSAHIRSQPTRRHPFRCRSCGKEFSVKTDSLMHGSHLGYQTWLIALYLFSTHPKGLSSIQFGKLLGIQQRTAWYMAHWIRENWGDELMEFAGPVEVDETFVGGWRRTSIRARSSMRAPTGLAKALWWG